MFTHEHIQVSSGPLDLPVSKRWNMGDCSECKNGQGGFLKKQIYQMHMLV